VEHDPEPTGRDEEKPAAEHALPAIAGETGAGEEQLEATSWTDEAQAAHGAQAAEETEISHEGASPLGELGDLPSAEDLEQPGDEAASWEEEAQALDPVEELRGEEPELEWEAENAALEDPVEPFPLHESEKEGEGTELGDAGDEADGDDLPELGEKTVAEMLEEGESEPPGAVELAGSERESEPAVVRESGDLQPAKRGEETGPDGAAETAREEPAHDEELSAAGAEAESAEDETGGDWNDDQSVGLEALAAVGGEALEEDDPAQALGTPGELPEETAIPIEDEEPANDRAFDLENRGTTSPALSALPSPASRAEPTAGARPARRKIWLALGLAAALLVTVASGLLVVKPWKGGDEAGSSSTPPAQSASVAGGPLTSPATGDSGPARVTIVEAPSSTVSPAGPGPEGEEASSAQQSTGAAPAEADVQPSKPARNPPPERAPEPSPAPEPTALEAASPLAVGSEDLPSPSESAGTRGGQESSLSALGDLPGVDAMAEPEAPIQEISEDMLRPQIRLGQLVDFAILDSQPRPVVTIKPEYPRMAILRSLTGKVFVNVLVGPDGSVEESRVASGPHEILNRAAADAVRSWRYTSPVKGGVNVRTWKTEVIVFK
jgi:TonB family protein